MEKPNNRLLTMSREKEIKPMDPEEDPQPRTSTDSLGEETPLLKHASTSGMSDSVGSSTRSDGRSSIIGFSRHWLNTKDGGRDKFSSERDRAVDRGVVQAAFLIRDAVLGESENPSKGTYDPYANAENSLRNLASLVFRQILCSRLLRQTLVCVVWCLALLTFVEPPRWCNGGMEGNASRNCEALFYLQGPAAGSGNETATEDTFVDYYPSSKSNLLTRDQTNVLEFIGASFVTLIILFRIGRDGCSLFRYLRKGPALVVRALQIVALAGIYAGLYTGYTFFQPFARLLLLGTFLISVHQEVATTLLVLPEVFNICSLLLIFVLFWAFFGTVLFYDTPQGAAGFSSLVESMWTLWICITTANYPDVMMPSYNENRLAGIYFVGFMIFSFFFFMNLILASVVNTYDDVIKDRNKAKQEYEQAKLREAFEIMDVDKTGTIDRETIMTLFRILNNDFPEFPHISSRDAKILYAILDRDGSSVINVNEFLDFGSILLLEFFHEKEFHTLVQTTFPKLYHSQRYQRFVKFVKSNAFETVVDVILVLNAVVVVIQSWPIIIGEQITVDENLLDGSIDTYWELCEAIFTLIYCVEAALKILAMGWRSYIEQFKNVFDFSITVFAFVTSAYVYYPNAFSDSRVIRYIVMARVLRLVRLVIALEPFRMIGVITYEIIPYASSVMCLLFCFMYCFAALGVELYGGMVTRDPSNPLSYLMLDNDFSNNDYWGNNFNDMISAFNVLFNLLIVNNWTECELGFEAVTQQKWVRYYFFAFHFVGVILVNNLVVAFFINSYLQQGIILKKRKDKLVVEGEAVITGREAKFDASTVTGTRTSIVGGFIARIRSNHAEEDEQDRLRRLFTQTSDVDDIQYKAQEGNEHVLPFARS